MNTPCWIVVLLHRALDGCAVVGGVLLLLWLGGCAQATRPVAVECPPVTIARPPQSLTLDTPEPLRTYTRNGELLEYAWDLHAALGQCNADKAALRGWMNGRTEVQP